MFQNNPNSKKIFNSYKLACEILEYRGFVLSTAQKTLTIKKNFDRWVNDRPTEEVLDELSFCVTENTAPKKDLPTICLWPQNKSLNSLTMNEVIKKMDEVKAVKALIFIEANITAMAKSTLKNLRRNGTQKKILNVWSYAEAQFNIMRHRSVFPHHVCSIKEKAEIFQKYKVSNNGLPGILLSDPVVKFLGAQKGDLIKIIRNSTVCSGDRSISYRLVKEKKTV